MKTVSPFSTCSSSNSIINKLFFVSWNIFFNLSHYQEIQAERLYLLIISSIFSSFFIRTMLHVFSQILSHFSVFLAFSHVSQFNNTICFLTFHICKPCHRWDKTNDFMILMNNCCFALQTE